MPNISPKAIYWGKTLSKFVSAQLFVQALSFASGILIIRTLDEQQYAYFTIANTMQGAMSVLADSGISYSVLAIGGKVWQDKYRFGQLVNTALQLRIYFAVVSIVIISPILFWVLTSNEASVTDTILITAAVILGLNAQLTTYVLDVVLQLHSQIDRIQKLDLISAISRLALLSVAYFIFLDVVVAILTASTSSVLKRFILRHWITESIDITARTDRKNRIEVLGIIKDHLPNNIFYCVQGQLTVVLISIFGSTQSIAEVGALGRLAIMFYVVSTVLSKIILPRFARCQSVEILRRQYWQIIGSYCLFGVCVVGLTAIFPTKILWILGENYTHLQNELILIALNTVLNAIVATMWSINATKVWIQYSWLNIPGTILMQVFLLLILDVSSTEGVIWFGILSTIPTFIVNALLTYQGFFSYNSKIS